MASFLILMDDTAIGTNPAESNGDGTTHPGRLLPI
jgi:hypothetical protein